MRRCKIFGLEPQNVCFGIGTVGVYFDLIFPCNIRVYIYMYVILNMNLYIS